MTARTSGLSIPMPNATVATMIPRFPFNKGLLIGTARAGIQASVGKHGHARLVLIE